MSAGLGRGRFGCGLFTPGPVDPLAEQVKVAAVPAGRLDQVGERVPRAGEVDAEREPRRQTMTGRERSDARTPRIAGWAS